MLTMKRRCPTGLERPCSISKSRDAWLYATSTYFSRTTFARVLDVLREKQTRSMVSRDVVALDMKHAELNWFLAWKFLWLLVFFVLPNEVLTSAVEEAERLQEQLLTQEEPRHRERERERSSKQASKRDVDLSFLARPRLRGFARPWPTPGPRGSWSPSKAWTKAGRVSRHVSSLCGVAPPRSGGDGSGKPRTGRVPKGGARLAGRSPERGQLRGIAPFSLLVPSKDSERRAFLLPSQTVPNCPVSPSATAGENGGLDLPEAILCHRVLHCVEASLSARLKQVSEEIDDS